MTAPRRTWTSLASLSFCASCSGLFWVMSLMACTSEPLDFADWTIPVPEGTSIIEYAGVPIEEREDPTIELVRDLEIGSDSEIPETTFYRPVDIAVDDFGRIYVVDEGDQRLSVFDRSGNHLHDFGQRGEGPGEFMEPEEIALGGGRLVVVDWSRSILSMWDLEANHLEDVALPTRILSDVFCLDDGSLIGSTTEFSRGETGRLREEFLVRVGADGREAARIFQIPEQRGETSIAVPQARTRHAVSPTGEIYLTMAEEYQVHALDRAGQMQWALRVAWERAPITQEIRDGVQPYLDTLPEREQEMEWPEEMPALSGLSVDGHGHIYVFPYTYFNETLHLGLVDERWADLGEPPPPPEFLPVDVFSSEGELLFSGNLQSGGIERMYWHAARGDHIYRIATDMESGEMYVERYRLVEPF